MSHGDHFAKWRLGRFPSRVEDIRIWSHYLKHIYLWSYLSSMEKKLRSWKGWWSILLWILKQKILGVSYTTPGDTWGFRMIPKYLSACQEAFLATASCLKILLASVLKTRWWTLCRCMFCCMFDELARQNWMLGLNWIWLSFRFLQAIQILLINWPQEIWLAI